MKQTIIIPARYASTRFPGKPLVPFVWAFEYFEDVGRGATRCR